MLRRRWLQRRGQRHSRPLDICSRRRRQVTRWCRSPCASLPRGEALSDLDGPAKKWWVVLCRAVARAVVHAVRLGRCCLATRTAGPDERAATVGVWLAVCAGADEYAAQPEWCVQNWRRRSILAVREAGAHIACRALSLAGDAPTKVGEKSSKLLEKHHSMIWWSRVPCSE